MKKLFLLTSIFALAACGGGGGGGGAPLGGGTSISGERYSTPAAVRSANAAVTSMETFSSSADAIVAAVSAAGIDLSNTSTVSDPTISAASHRSASADALASAYDATASTAQKRAMAELKNMYRIAIEDGEYDPSDRQLYNAYVLSGGDASDYDPENLSDGDRTAISAAVVSRLASIQTTLDSMVEKDGPVYQWRPITETLEGVKFRLGSEDSYFKFTLDTDGKIISGGKWDSDGLGSYALSAEGEYVRNGNSNSFVGDKKLYVWSYNAPTGNAAKTELVTALMTAGNVPGGTDSEREAHAIDMATHILEQLYKPIEAMDDNSELALATVKTRLISRITDKVNKANGYDGSYDDAFADAVAFYTGKINALTAADLPSTEFDTRLNINGANVGLKYADMGSAELLIANANSVRERTFTPYVGGYDAREATVSSDVTFTGTAIAGIDSKKTHGGSETTDGMLVRDDTAQLTMFSNGKAKLVMNNLVGIDSDHAGQKWNNLTVETTDPTEAHGAPKFTVERVDGVPDDFQMKEFDDGKIVVAFAEGDWNAAQYQHSQHTGPVTRTIDDVEHTDVGIRYGGMAEFNAYGPSTDNPTEATARYGFSEERHWNSNADHEEVAIYGAFGGKK